MQGQRWALEDAQGDGAELVSFGMAFGLSYISEQSFY